VRRVTHDRPSPVLIVVAEGITPPAGERRLKVARGIAIAEGLQSRTGFDARCTVLGHLQRGGSPAVFDRILGSAFGTRAIHSLAAGESRRMVAWRGGVVTDIPMAEVTTGPRFVKADSQLMRAARRLGHLRRRRFLLHLKQVPHRAPCAGGAIVDASYRDFKPYS